MKTNEIENLINVINNNKDLSVRDFSLKVEQEISKLSPMNHDCDNIFESTGVNSNVMGLAVAEASDEVPELFGDGLRNSQEIEIMEKHLTKRECILLFQSSVDEFKRLS